MAYSKIKNHILSSIIKKRINRINKSKQEPLKIQNKILHNLIRKGSKTNFGKAHNFYRIKDYHSFKENIPLRTYEELHSYIIKAQNGEKNILWPGKVKWFAKSSGTTNAASKYIPITKDALYECHLKGGKDMLSLYANNFTNVNLYNGKGLMLGGSINLSKKGHKEGDLSAILLNQFPFWVNYHRFPDYKTAVMSDWNKKIEKISIQASKENITNITGVPSWTLIILQNILKKTGKKNDPGCMAKFRIIYSWGN